MKSNKIIATCITALDLIYYMPSSSEADFLEAIQTPIPGMVEVTGTHSDIDTLVDKYGKKREADIDTNTLNVTIKGKSPRLSGSVTFPYSSKKNNLTGNSVSGLGDISGRVGIHGKRDNLYFLLMGETKLPTGDYNKERLSVGTGQTELSLGLRVTGLYDEGKRSMDFGVIGTHSTGDSSDKITIRATPGQKFGDIRVGLEGIGNYALDSGIIGIKIGGLLKYEAKEWNITGYLGKDIYSRNTSQGSQYGLIFRRIFR